MSGDVLVLILAGGAGSRIGGQKPLRILHGEKMLDRALRQAHQWSDCVTLSLRDPQQLGPLTVPYVVDAEGIEGPLSGLLSGLHMAQESGRDLLLTIPADMPFLPPDLLVRLRASLCGHGVAMAASGGELHPVCALWPVARSLKQAGAYLATGRRSLKGFAEMIGFISVDWPNGSQDPFFNVNDAIGLKEAERRISG